MKPELKPCPFCGGESHSGFYAARHKIDEYYMVMCWNCFARTIGETVDEAIEAWNRRVEDEA